MGSHSWIDHTTEYMRWVAEMRLDDDYDGFSGGLWIFPVMVALGVVIQFFETFAEWKKLVICTGRTSFPDNPT